MTDYKYSVVPGRGLLTKSAMDVRKDYLTSLGITIENVEKTTIDRVDIQNNIESLIGSVEIPVGLVGPLLYSNTNEEVFCLGATLEGALIASMNRGAKAISLSGGFQAQFIHQKMVRSPLFILSSFEKAIEFENWLQLNFQNIKAIAENYSNHACLQELRIHQDEKHVHVSFVYTTGDAAGQNMTTTCTWHAMLWIVDRFDNEGYEKIEEYVLEGNGSSDKKVSQFLMDHGRGSKVIASCILQEEVIQKILRTTSHKLLTYYHPSRNFALKNGMVGYSINAANAIAAIFAATGQDLASIHESSVAELELEKHPEGLSLKITLFSLVAGTLGGGTQLPKQKEALQVMKCYGSDKIERFASLIAGFVLGLEISTYAAIVSGEFAKAHEKLGRNKPIDWLQWNEINSDFIKTVIPSFKEFKSLEISVLKGEIDNGILMNLSKKVNRKLIGFIPVDIELDGKLLHLLLKSKATDLETIKGLHLMAASVDPILSDLITQNKDYLEHTNCHKKELFIPKFLNENGFHWGPKYFDSYANDAREIYILAQERLDLEKLLLIDSENSPHLWTEIFVKKAISAIHLAHSLFLKVSKAERPTFLTEFDCKNALPLYSKLVEIAIDEDSTKQDLLFEILHSFDEEEELPLNITKTLIHNDFNPRNVAVRKNGEICIYDWELAVLHYPHRDIIEFLSFTLPDNFTKEDLFLYLEFHYSMAQTENQNWETWKKGYEITLKEYILSRVLFYSAAEVVMKLKFANRVYNNSIRMLEFLKA